MTDDDDSNDSQVDMAECGACRAVIPIDSTSCSGCGVSFSGVAEDDMGECGACGTLVPLDSKSCSQCGVHFVLDDLTTALSNWMKDESLTISELFGVVDADGDGSLTSTEVKDALLERDLAFLGSKDLDRFLSQIDLNDDGVISFPELAAALSMPWTPPEELTVLEPEATEEESDDDDSDDAEEDSIEDDDGDSDDEEEDSVEDDDGDSDDEEEESDDDDSEEDELRYTEHVLERVMKAHDITDKEAFLAHATSSDKDGNNFLREAELTEAAILWNAKADSEDEQDEDSEDDDDSEDEEEEDSEDDDDSEDEEEEDSEDDDDSDSVETQDDDDWDENEPAVSEAKDEGPAQWQRFLMRNYENAFPVLYTIGALFVAIWLVNAMGILVDGSGGPIAFNGDSPHTEFTTDENGFVTTTVIQPGEIYDCSDEVQVDGCKNSLTPFAGENGASSMPAGFYWDGILFMILGLAGLGGIGYLQMQIKAMRAEHRRSKSSDSDDESDSSESVEEDEQSDDTEDEDVESEDGSDDEEDDSDDDEDDSNDDDDEEEDSNDDDDDSNDDEDDGIEIGSRVGVEDEDGDWYGEVIEFDDDEDAVVVKREDDGEEYVVDWDALFQDD